MLGKRFLAQFIIIAVLAALAWWVRSREQPAPHTLPAPTEQTRGGSESGTPAPKPGQAPKAVLEVLQYVRQYHKAPDGYVGGRTFENREKRLPVKTKEGATIRYQEWDVHPKIRGQNRGTDRLITGSDKSAYYTENHYKTFKKIEDW